MFKQSIKTAGPSAAKTVPQAGAVSSVGPSGKAPSPRVKNTRDYGKKQSEAPSLPSEPSPFGSAGSY